MRIIQLSSLFFACSAALAVTSLQAQERVVIQNKGSDTLVNAAQSWADAYSKVKPKVAIAVSGGGSGTGIAAMIAGTVDIANASRAMSEKEIAEARQHGQEPIQHIVGHDALAIFVNMANPIKGITREQLAQIYGRDGKFTKWSDIGVSVPGCPTDKMVLVSRQNNSGTYAYFKEHVIGEKGKFRQGTLDMHGSKDVVDLVEKTPCAIGYSGLGYANPHVKMPCVSDKEGSTCINPSLKTALDGTYPIARPLFMYTNGEPKGEVKAYLDWIKSDAGQCILIEQGYAPLHDVKCK